MEMKNWNGPRMPNERKWAKDAQGGRNGPRKPVSNRMGQGSPSSMNADPMTMLVTVIKWKKSIQQVQKRPSKHRSNNTATGIIEWHGRNASKFMKGTKEWVKERKAHNQVRPSPWRKQATKNESSETRSRHKRSKVGSKMHKQASRPWQMHKQQTSFGHIGK